MYTIEYFEMMDTFMREVEEWTDFEAESTPWDE